jgi:chemotaxis protein methyltransferase CheR
MSIAPADFAYVRELVHRRSAISLEAGKEDLVESRLLPIVRASGEDSLDRLVSRLRSSPEGALHEQVVEAMTTNETSWFRDRHPFESLESVILPDLLPRRAAERGLTIWSAAAATGQEAYSIAMVLHDRLAADPTWNLRVLATDLSEEMVRRTRAGSYSQLEINRGLPAAKLVRHFTRAGTEWQINEPLRRMVEARQLNLAAPFPPLPPVDVLFLRNVLIYFKPDTRRQIFDRVRRVLRPDGYLVLGGAGGRRADHDHRNRQATRSGKQTLDIPGDHVGQLAECISDLVAGQLLGGQVEHRRRGSPCELFRAREQYAALPIASHRDAADGDIDGVERHLLVRGADHRADERAPHILGDPGDLLITSEHLPDHVAACPPRGR